MLHERIQDAPRVLTVEDATSRIFERRQFCLACPGKFDITDLNDNFGNPVHDGVKGAIRLSGALVFDVARNGILHQESLQDVGNTIRQIPRERQLAIEHGGTFLDALQKFFVGEPDKILETYRHEFFNICDLENELGSSGGRIRKGVGDVGEYAYIAKAPGSFLEIFFNHGGADLKSAGRDNIGFRVVFAAVHLDRAELSHGNRQVVEGAS